MSKANDTSNLAMEKIMRTSDELRDEEIGAVTGGLVVSAIFAQPLISWNIGRPPRKRCRDGGLEGPAKPERILAASIPRWRTAPTQREKRGSGPAARVRRYCLPRLE